MKAKTTSPFEINTSNKDNIVIIDLNNDKDTKVLLETIKKEVSKFCSDIDELNLYKILEEKVLNLNVYIPIN